MKTTAKDFFMLDFFEEQVACVHMTYTNAYAYVCMYVRTYVYVCMYVCMPAHTFWICVFKCANALNKNKCPHGNKG